MPLGGAANTNNKDKKKCKGIIYYTIRINKIPAHMQKEHCVIYEGMSHGTARTHWLP